jgi:uracil-DNA glycosylase
VKELQLIHARIRGCKACPDVIGPPVHGPAISSPVFLLGQAPGPHEGERGKPFAHTAGKTLFRWFEEASGISEEVFRERIYMAAVARCFPGKGKGAGDRVPSAIEISNCSRHLRQELQILRPTLILAVGKLAITQTLNQTLDLKLANLKLIDVVGKKFHVRYLGHEADVICLPHPSGLSAWHKIEPGKSLLKRALQLVVRHEAWALAVE